MPHPAKSTDPISRHDLKRTVTGGPNKPVTKKGGAGGKGTWGKPGDEYWMSDFIDPDDPIYDPDEEVGSMVMEVSEDAASKKNFTAMAEVA